MKGIVRLVDVVNSYQELGHKRLIDDTYLVGQMPSIGENAWLHALFKGLKEEEITDLERLIGKFPKEYKIFLSQFNGFSIFSGVLELYGKRKNNIRTIEYVWQPYDLIAVNQRENRAIADKGLISIGSYNWDGSIITINFANEIVRVERDSIVFLNKWKDLNTFLFDEIHRIDRLFDSKGCEFDDDLPTVPRANLGV